LFSTNCLQRPTRYSQVNIDHAAIINSCIQTVNANKLHNYMIARGARLEGRQLNRTGTGRERGAYSCRRQPAHCPNTAHRVQVCPPTRRLVLRPIDALTTGRSNTVDLLSSDDTTRVRRRLARREVQEAPFCGVELNMPETVAFGDRDGFQRLLKASFVMVDIWWALMQGMSVT